MSHSGVMAIGAPRRALLVLLAVVCAGGVFHGEAIGQVEAGRTERVTVHGASLEGNLSDDPADREVSVYLPPSYANDTDRRYPVVYMLHGYTDDDAKWFGLVDHWIHLPPIVDTALADPDTREMIIVMPNAYTRFHGSMYSSSVVTGDWERFIAEDLVAYIDTNYRTIPDATSRGIAGHSMGGYGAMRIGMKRPDVFSSVYLLSPCCLAPRLGGGGGDRKSVV